MTQRRRFGCMPRRAGRLASDATNAYVQKLASLAADLPGCQSVASRNYFAEMLVASDEWVEELKRLSRGQSRQGVQPGEHGWDARLEIVRLARAREIEEATWLAFLCIVLGELDDRDPWRSVGQLYSGFGVALLSWQSVSVEPSLAYVIFRKHPTQARALKFANHRKFESQVMIPDVIASYVAVIRTHGGSQARWFGGGSESPKDRFTRLVTEAQAIRRFGRLAAYDFLVLLGSLGVHRLEPERLYLEGATGPLNGARLLFADQSSKSLVLDQRASHLASELGTTLRAMEDALCNWQKEASSL